MFDWLNKRRYQPMVPADNPGRGCEATISFEGPAPRTEHLRMLPLLAEQLTRQGFAATEQNGWLLLPNGLLLQPLLLSVNPRDDGGAQCATTVSVCHAQQIPGGLFEYQYSNGPTAIQAITDGFEQWIQLDLQTLCEAVEAAKPQDGQVLMHMRMNFPASDTHGQLTRRVVLGHTMRVRQQPDETAEAEHPFCPCCLLTNSLEGFEAQLKSEQLYGLRLFASRDSEGQIQADCRVNGQEWPQGAQALMDYVRSWPDQGFELRKQYVVICNG